MISAFKHRGLRHLYQGDDHRGVNAEHASKIMAILALLDIAKRPEDMDLATLKLHALKGGLGGFWSVTVRANWRIIFRFEGSDATDVDYLDYY